MSIERTNIFFISGINCNWSSVIGKKQTEGPMASQTKLNVPAALVELFSDLRIAASTRQVVAASLRLPRRSLGEGWSRRSVGGTATPAFVVLRRWQAAPWLSRERSCRGGL